MLKFHPLTIAGRTTAAEDAIALSFAVPAALRDEYRFVAGQHLALRLRIDGQEERRTYSIVNPEGARRLTIGVRVQKDGAVEHSLDPRRSARPSTCRRRFFFIAETMPGSAVYAAFAAGSGITPCFDRGDALDRLRNRFQLYYGYEHGTDDFLEEVQHSART